MNKTCCLIFLGFFLVACSPSSASSLTPSIEIVWSPPATSAIAVSQTPTVFAPTATIQPTADPNFFRDDFNGSLDVQWSWVRENPGNWRLSDPSGTLEIQVDQGYVAAHNNPNLLLRPAPEDDFQIETQVTVRPETNFQFAGLIVYESDSNFVQAGRAYCDAVGCVGDGFYMDYYRKGVVVKPDFGQAFNEIDPVLLRLTRQGDTYSFEVSTDGKVWFMIGRHTSDMNPLQIGLVAGQTLRGPTVLATFEYFEVRSLP